MKDKNKIPDGAVKKSIFTTGLGKTLIVLCIVFLAVMDGFSTYELFEGSDETPLRSFLFGVLFAGLLEGIPSLISFWMIRFFDVNKNKDPLKSKITSILFVALLVAMIGIFSAEIGLRFHLISIKEQDGSYGTGQTVEINETDEPAGSIADLKDDGQDEITKKQSKIRDIFLMLSPIFTSIVAFALSMIVFKSDPLSEQRGKLNKLTWQVNKQSETVNALKNEFEQEKRLLYAVAAPRDAIIPESGEVFAENAYNYSVDKARKDVYESIPRLAESFSDKGRAALLRYLTLLGQKTTVPLKITNLDIDNFLAEYDAKQTDENKYSGKEASQSLVDEFKRRVAYTGVDLPVDKPPERPVLRQSGISDIQNPETLPPDYFEM